MSQKDEEEDREYSDEEEDEEEDIEEKARLDATLFSPDVVKRGVGVGSVYKERVFIVYHGEESNQSNLSLLSLPHPKKGVQTKYFTTSNNKLLEIQRMLDEPCCWFIDNAVEKDGTLYMATPMDPLFLALPLLANSRKKTSDHDGFFCLIEQAFVEDTCPDLAGLVDMIDTAQFDLVCDKRVIRDDKKVYRLNDEKTLNWLRAKVKQMTNILQNDKSVVATNSSTISTFVPVGMKDQGPSQDEILRTALGFISEYINEDLLKALSSSFGMADFEAPLSTPAPVLSNSTPTSKSKSSERSKTTPKKAQPTTSHIQKKLVQASKGVTSITSFFVPQKKQKTDQ